MTTPVELEPFTLKHDALKTTFRGVVTLPEVVQFRGIKYASIPKRFARSEVVTSYGAEEVDATKSGWVSCLLLCGVLTLILWVPITDPIALSVNQTLD